MIGVLAQSRNRWVVDMARVEEFDKDSKYVFLSDCHRGAAAWRTSS